MIQLLPLPPIVPTSVTDDWMHDRLTEARSVLADATRHPDSLVIIAARVVIGLAEDARECADAIDVLRLLDRRPLHVVGSAAFPKGGAA